MPIQEGNIVFVESQILDDVPEGGGAATGRVVPDGVLNNVFEDISDLDRAYGRFNLRKLFLAVRSLDTDLYGGAKLAVTALPSDPALGYALFSTKDPFDTRLNAANRVASYLYKGPMWHGALYENHISGMRAISVIQRVGTRLPPIGKTLCLVQFEGAGNQIEQYVRVVKVEAVVQTFSDSQGDYQRLIVTMSLSDALRHNFVGHVPHRFDTYNYTTGVRLRDTTVADVTNYYSSRPVKTWATVGDTQIQVDSVFTQLVPSGRTESIQADRLAGGLMTQTIASGPNNFEIISPAHTLAIPITPENRSFSYVTNCVPIPAPGACIVQWRVLGNWYIAQADTNGTFIGDLTGQLNYSTGTLQMTFSALPDADSAVLITWATRLHFTDNAGASQQLDGIIVRGDFGSMVARNTVTFSWLSGGTMKTATTAQSGLVSGHGKGFVAPSGKWWLDVAGNVPDTDAEIVVSYDPAPVHTETLNITPTADGTLIAVLEGQPMPGSVEASWIVKHGTTEAVATVTKIMGTKDVQECKWVDAPAPSAYVVTVSFPAVGTGWGAGGAQLEIQFNATFATAELARTFAETVRDSGGANGAAYSGSQDQGGAWTIAGSAATVKAVHLIGITQAEYTAGRTASVSGSRKFSPAIQAA